MPLPRTTDYCPICGAILEGRLDKRFCSSRCRSVYFRNKARQRNEVTANVNSILEKNWKILSEIHASIGKRKFYVELAVLNKRGFHLNYYTTTYINSKSKTYFFVYDYGWMIFSDKEVMVTKLNRPK